MFFDENGGFPPAPGGNKTDGPPKINLMGSGPPKVNIIYFFIKNHELDLMGVGAFPGAHRFISHGGGVARARSLFSI